MKLPSGVSRRDAGMVLLVVVTVVLFVLCAYLAGASF
jgi:hypothetical protein